MSNNSQDKSHYSQANFSAKALMFEAIKECYRAIMSPVNHILRIGHMIFVALIAFLLPQPLAFIAMIPFYVFSFAIVLPVILILNIARGVFNALSALTNVALYPFQATISCVFWSKDDLVGSKQERQKGSTPKNNTSENVVGRQSFLVV